LQNHDKWLALAKKPSMDARPQAPLPHPHTSTTNIKKVISPTSATTVKQREPVQPVSLPPAPAPAPAPTPVAPTFDINDIYNKIHNEKKLKEQQVR
jgi:hypothetical protein